jgi:hypothetical protein
MNSEKEKSLLNQTQRNPYWVCMVVFLALATDQGFRLLTQLDQRNQLTQAQSMQAQNINMLYEAQQLEVRLQNLSLDLLQVAKTNAQAKQIVQDFNIQWNPGPAAAPVPPASGPGQPAFGGAGPPASINAPKK